PGDLSAAGRITGPSKPWLGVTTNELHGRLLVSRVTPGGPAEQAGLQRGDVIVGVNDDKATGLADFYRKVRAVGSAGVAVPLDVLQDDTPRRIEVKSINRRGHLKLKSTY